MEDIKKQRYYIYENINKLKNHNQIIDLINIEGCKYTENDNGIFLNLNTIDDKLVTMIYHTILNNINYKEDIYDNINKNINQDDLYDINSDFSSDKNETVKQGGKEYLSFKEFSKKDHEIIEHSKKYNL